MIPEGVGMSEGSILIIDDCPLFYANGGNFSGMTILLITAKRCGSGEARIWASAGWDGKNSRICDGFLANVGVK